jgi:hypothetical protein
MIVVFKTGAPLKASPVLTSRGPPAVHISTVEKPSLFDMFNNNYQI